MAASIAIAFTQGSFGDEASSIWALPWGKVTVIDIYAGLAVFGAWVAYREKRPLRIALWWLALVTLGNLTTGVYLIVALRRAGSLDELLLGRSNTT